MRRKTPKNHRISLSPYTKQKNEHYRSRCAVGLFFACPCDAHRRAKFRARNTKFAGRSANLRMKYGYQAFP